MIIINIYGAPWGGRHCATRHLPTTMWEAGLLTPLPELPPKDLKWFSRAYIPSKEQRQGVGLGPTFSSGFTIAILWPMVLQNQQVKDALCVSSFPDTVGMEFQDDRALSPPLASTSLGEVLSSNRQKGSSVWWCDRWSPLLFNFKEDGHPLLAGGQRRFQNLSIYW